MSQTWANLTQQLLGTEPPFVQVAATPVTPKPATVSEELSHGCIRKEVTRPVVYKNGFGMHDSPVSCGVQQLTGLAYVPEPEKCVECIKDILLSQGVARHKNQEGHHHAMPPFITFSDVVDGYGENLAKYITEKGLGKMYETDAVLNPSVLRHSIKLWIWQVDYKALGIHDRLCKGKGAGVYAL